MDCKTSIGCLISSIHRYGQIYIGKELEPYDIGSGQFPFLMRLYHEDGINQESLAQLFNVDKATSARAIRKLVEEGYVFKQKDADDRRSYRVFLTDKGREIRPVMENISSKFTDIVLADLAETEKRNVLPILEKMLQNVSHIK